MEPDQERMRGGRQPLLNGQLVSIKSIYGQSHHLQVWEEAISLARITFSPGYDSPTPVSSRPSPWRIPKELLPKCNVRY